VSADSSWGSFVTCHTLLVCVRGENLAKVNTARRERNQGNAEIYALNRIQIPTGGIGQLLLQQSPFYMLPESLSGFRFPAQWKDARYKSYRI
jgi:hypothetical protein